MTLLVSQKDVSISDQVPWHKFVASSGAIITTAPIPFPGQSSYKLNLLYCEINIVTVAI